MDLVEIIEDDLQLQHTFSDGVYCRSVTMPKGSLIVGHVHKTNHVNIMSTGSARVWIDGVIQELVAPCIFESPAGSRKALLIHEDCTFTNVHVTNEKNLDKLRKDLINEDMSDINLIDLKETLWLG